MSRLPILRVDNRDPAFALAMRLISETADTAAACCGVDSVADAMLAIYIGAAALNGDPEASARLRAAADAIDRLQRERASAQVA